MMQSFEIRVPGIERSFCCMSCFYNFWDSIKNGCVAVGCGASTTADLKLEGLRVLYGAANGELLSKCCVIKRKELDFCVLRDCAAALQLKDSAIRIGEVL